MPPITLRQIYEEENTHLVNCRIIIGGAAIPTWTSLTYGFSIGEGPTATITIPSREVLPFAVAEEASVLIYLGFRKGLSLLEKLVFAGGVVDSVGNNGPETVIECVMDGPRKLQYSYNRRITYDFTAVDANKAASDLLDLAGVTNYFVDLETWAIGTAVPQKIEFSTYGEAVNKIAEVDGSPWYVLPTGQVRVENRPSIPNDTARRQYFTGQITGIVSAQPTGVTNIDALPRINDIQRRKFRAEVANFIEVDGAVVVTAGPNGEQNSNQVIEQVDGSSGQFPNGAYWIPTPPLFQDFTFSNDLVDTNAKAFEVAERYFNLKNRLIERTPISVPVDPDVFLGETIEIIDPDYSGVSSLYFVEGYRTTIDSSGGTTELQLVGGPESGTIGQASPFAEFVWKYQAIHNLIPGGLENQSNLDLGPNADLGSKICQDLPAEIGSPDQGADFAPGTDRPVVFIGLDGSVSDDFDGFITDYFWADDQGHGTIVAGEVTSPALTGPQVTFVYDPDAVSSVQMTLTVTDNDGRKRSITKTVYTSATHINVPGGHTNPSQNDWSNGGGVVSGDCTPCGQDSTVDCGHKQLDNPADPGLPGPGQKGSGQPGDGGCGGCNGIGTVYFVAAGNNAMATINNTDWQSLTPAAAGATGDFVSVCVVSDLLACGISALFGTTTGMIVRTTDVCATGSVVFRGSGSIVTIWADSQENKRIWASSSNGSLYTSIDNGVKWSTFKIFDSLVNVIGTPPGGSLWLFGGDTGDISSLIRIKPKGASDFIPLAIEGALRDAILAAGPGFTITASATNDTASLIGFSGGVVPAIWTNSDPLGAPGNWIPAIGGPSSVRVASSGFGSFFITDSHFTIDNENFTPIGSPPSQINQLFWQGLPGVYLAASDGGMLITIDSGATWGYMMPNTTFGTTLPIGAIGYNIGYGIGPRPCIPAYSFPALHGVFGFEGDNVQHFTSGVSIFHVDPAYDVRGIIVAIVLATGASGGLGPVQAIGPNSLTSDNLTWIEGANIVYNYTGADPQAADAYNYSLFWAIKPPRTDLKVVLGFDSVHADVAHASFIMVSNFASDTIDVNQGAAAFAVTGTVSLGFTPFVNPSNIAVGIFNQAPNNPSEWFPIGPDPLIPENGHSYGFRTYSEPTNPIVLDDNSAAPYDKKQFLMLELSIAE